MKLSYHKYFIQRRKNRFQHNLFLFLKRFTEVDAKNFKYSFSSHGDRLFLFHLTHRMFLFIVTKDKEIIKTINSEDYSHQDIQDRLDSNENIGFASYVYFGKHFYGIASTFYGPKNLIFNSFINDIFNKLDLDNYRFESMPFPIEANRKSVKKLEFKSAVRFDINSANPLYDEIMEFFGSPQDTDKISIQFKPVPRGQMEDTFDKIMDSLDDEGLNNFIAKGKESLQDSLVDFYITGTGHIADSITAKGELEICSSIKDKISKNTLLLKGIGEYEKDDNYIKKNIKALANFNNLDAWDSYI